MKTLQGTVQRYTLMAWGRGGNGASCFSNNPLRKK